MSLLVNQAKVKTFSGPIKIVAKKNSCLLWIKWSIKGKMSVKSSLNIQRNAPPQHKSELSAPLSSYRK